MGELLIALSDVLTNHTLAIDLGDAHGELEREAYQGLTGEFSPLAERLQAAARLMAGYRDRPAARHDELALADPQGVEVFEQFVRAEEALQRLLAARLEEDRQMLRELVGS
jgi:hypothetical protein